MTKIDIFSGFLGAGKTTLIKKLITEAFAGQQVVLIENEFGEIGIDGGFLKESGIQINELNAGGRGRASGRAAEQLCHRGRCEQGQDVYEELRRVLR